MCRTAHALLSSLICALQMLVRILMTTMLMLENLLRMIMQTIYNLMSFILQIVSLLPLCCVFLVTARLKCFMCGGGGPCPVNRGGACDCLMSLIAIIILFFVFRATGVLDKIFYGIGYAKATTKLVRFVPTPGEITECSRNDTDTVYVFYGIETTTPIQYEDTTVEYAETTLTTTQEITITDTAIPYTTEGNDTTGNATVTTTTDTIPSITGGHATTGNKTTDTTSTTGKHATTGNKTTDTIASTTGGSATTENKTTVTTTTDTSAGNNTNLSTTPSRPPRLREGLEDPDWTTILYYLV